MPDSFFKSRPSLVGVAMQISGIEKIAPIYYLFSIAAGDTSTMNTDVVPEVAEVVLSTTVLAYIIPGALMALMPLTATEVSRSPFSPQSLVTCAFFIAPVAVPLLTTAISKAMKWFSHRHSPKARKKDDIPTNGLINSCGGNKISCHHQPRENPALKTAFAVSFAIQAAQHIYTMTRAFIASSSGQTTLLRAIGSVFLKPTVPGQRFSSMSLYAGATFGYGLYTVWNLRRRGYATTRDASKAVLGFLSGQVLFGPGATYAGLWLWREGVLTGGTHQLGLHRS